MPVLLLAIQELNTALEEPATQDSVQRRRVAQSLVKIGEILTEWGNTINNMGERPPLQTVHDVAVGISLLEQSIRRLKRWARSRGDSHGAKLLLKVVNAWNIHWSSTTKALFSTYLQLLEQLPARPRPTLIKKLNEYRFTAAPKLLDYAEALIDAGRELDPGVK